MGIYTWLYACIKICLVTNHTDEVDTTGTLVKHVIVMYIDINGNTTRIICWHMNT